jgi:hypothetical protein
VTCITRPNLIFSWLRFPSALKPVLFTLDPARVVHRIGALSAADLAQVDERLRRALAL